MTSSASLNALLRGSKLMRDAMGADILLPGSPLHIARPVDAESLIGRHEGRARKVAGGGAKPALSSALQKRIGPTRGLFSRTVRHGAFKYDPRQRAVVKVHYFGHGGGGATALRAHARYVARDVAARAPVTDLPIGDPGAESANTAQRSAEAQAQAHARYLSRGATAERSAFYDAFADGVDGSSRAAEWAKDDRRHFRLILSPENGTRLGDLKGYTREIMARAEASLGTSLQWVAVDHWDTDNPHTHIILRGRHEDGRDLVIPREYVSHGFRNAARDVATERLGPRSRDDARLALQNEVRAHRPTQLDQIIALQIGEDGTVRIARITAPNGAPELTDALKARAHELKRLGLATETSRNVLTFDRDWRERLTAMELHLDIRKSLLRARAHDLARGQSDPAHQLAKALRLSLGPDR